MLRKMLCPDPNDPLRQLFHVKMIQLAGAVSFGKDVKQPTGALSAN